MKNVSASISDQLYDALQEFCNRNNSNINQVLGRAVQGLLEGKIKMRPLGGQDVCPRCGHTVHLVQDNSKFYFWCHRCEWMAYLGKFTPPKDIEDWTKKIKEL